MKKSQITIFILLGIVIFIIFGFLIYVTSNLSESSLARQRERTKREFLTTTPIKYYITSCLDESAEKALRILGNQGGYIFNFQGGLVDRSVPFVSYNDSGNLYNVSYLIFRSNTTADHFNAKISQPAIYPCLSSSYLPSQTICVYGFPYSPYVCCDAPICPSDPLCDYCKFYGATCHKLYDHTLAQEGSGLWFDFGSIKNPKNQLRLDLVKSNISLLDLQYTCGTYSSDNWYNNVECNYSIQRQIEHYISRETEKCVNLTLFTGYNLTGDSINTEISFGVDDILVNIEYPIIIRQKNKPTVDTILSFSLPPKKVRLSKIYGDVVKKLIYDEIKYIAFNLKEEIENEEPNFIVKKLRPYPNTTVLIINDTLSKLGAGNYVFQFAMENRGPALNYVSSSLGYANGTSCNVLGVDYDVCVSVNETLVLKPKAYDPDDNFLAYTYSGWKSFDFISSDLYLNGNTSDCNESRRCITYKTTDSDSGTHDVKITAGDGQLTDWQIVKVYVNDKPNPDLSTTGTDGCKKAGGGVLDWAARANKPYLITADCGDPTNPPFTYQWYVNSVLTYQDVSIASCNPSHLFSLPAGIQTITLSVTDGLGANGMIVYTLRVYEDLDDDDFCRNSMPPSLSCAPSCVDCNDTNAAVNPLASDIACNGIDNDCDSLFDEDYVAVPCGNVGCVDVTQCVGGIPSCRSSAKDCGLCVNCSVGMNPSCNIPYAAGTEDETGAETCTLPLSCNGAIGGCT